jgi:hypothetical protein
MGIDMNRELDALVRKLLLENPICCATFAAMLKRGVSQEEAEAEVGRALPRLPYGTPGFFGF